MSRSTTSRSALPRTDARRRLAGLASRLLLTVLLSTLSLVAASGAALAEAGRVYTATNAAEGNEIVVYSRNEGGLLTFESRISTGGLGTGGGLGNQGGLAISEDDQWLLAVNAGSDSVSVFAITEEGLELTSLARTRGDLPVSVALSGRTAYVLNAGSDDVVGFRLDHRGRLWRLPASRRHLSGEGTGGAQVGFSADGRRLIVTEKATSRIDVFEVRFGGYLSRGQFVAASGETPFGFGFGRRGQLFVSQAAGGAAGASTLGAYRVVGRDDLLAITGAVPTLNSAACWVVVSIDQRTAWTTNTGSGTISGFRIESDGSVALIETDGISATLVEGSSPIDMGLTDDGRYLYVLSGGSNSITGYRVEAEGSLVEVEFVDGLPAGVNGLIAR